MESNFTLFAIFIFANGGTYPAMNILVRKVLPLIIAPYCRIYELFLSSLSSDRPSNFTLIFLQRHFNALVHFLNFYYVAIIQLKQKQQISKTLIPNIFFSLPAIIEIAKIVIPRWIPASAIYFMFASSCVNPFIYGLHNPQFRKAYRTVFTCCRPHRINSAPGAEIKPTHTTQRHDEQQN